MKRVILFSLLSILALASCNKSASGSAKAEKSEGQAFDEWSKKKSDGKHFGEALTQDGALTVDEVKTKLTGASLETKIIGKVETVCKNKGCWMNVMSETGKSPIFVQFKNYAFFMPIDIVGKKIVMKGVARKEVTTIEELKHFAMDEGKPQSEIDAIKTPKEDIKFLASGVLVLE
jgi:hypothetical protein